MLELMLTLYGPLRRYGVHTLQLPQGACVADARAALIAKIPDAAALLRVSAIGDDHSVLNDDASLASGSYAVLPPVSGG